MALGGLGLDGLELLIVLARVTHPVFCGAVPSNPGLLIASTIPPEPRPQLPHLHSFPTPERPMQGMWDHPG